MLNEKILIIGFLVLISTIGTAFAIDINFKDTGDISANGTSTFEDMSIVHGGWSLYGGSGTAKYSSVIPAATGTRSIYMNATALNFRYYFDFPAFYPSRVDWRMWDFHENISYFNLQIQDVAFTNQIGLGVANGGDGDSKYAIMADTQTYKNATNRGRGWHNFSVIRHTQDDIAFISDGVLVYNESIPSYIDFPRFIIEQVNGYLLNGFYFDDIYYCNGTASCYAPTTTPPNYILNSTYNLTSAYSNSGQWQTNQAYVIPTYDSTPTVEFNISAAGNCTISNLDKNFSYVANDNALWRCGTNNSISQSCTYPFDLNYGNNLMFLSCIASDGTGQGLNSTSGALSLKLYSIPTLTLNTTFPSTIYIGTGFKIGNNISNLDNSTIEFANYTLFYPNGTKALDNTNGTMTSGTFNTQTKWESANVSSTVAGGWMYNLTLFNGLSLFSINRTFTTYTLSCGVTLDSGSLSMGNVSLGQNSAEQTKYVFHSGNAIADVRVYGTIWQGTGVNTLDINRTAFSNVTGTFASKTRLTDTPQTLFPNLQVAGNFTSYWQITSAVSDSADSYNQTVVYAATC